MTTEFIDMSVSILDQFLDPLTDSLTPEAARIIADCQPKAELLEALECLREKANEGELTPAERAEYEEFVETMDLVAILKSKARAAAVQKNS